MQYGMNKPQNSIEATHDVYRNLKFLRQPMFDHLELIPGFEVQKNQIQAVKEICKILEKKVGRKLRILEIGSAQGYGTLSFAKLGHSVTTIEWEKENYSFLLQLIDGVSFKHNIASHFLEIESLGEKIDSNFDLAISLGSLEHVYRCLNLDKQKIFFDFIASHTSVAMWDVPIFEDRAHWNWSLPEDPLIQFNERLYMGEIGWFLQHSRGYKRPLIITSDKYVLNGETLYEIKQSGSFTKHPFTDENTLRRKSFNLGDVIIKTELHPLDLGEGSEIFAEAQFLKNISRRLSKILRLPKIKYVNNGRLMSQFGRTSIPGQRIDEILNSENYEDVLRHFIHLCAELAHNGIFPNDLRPWNILWDGKRCNFIDFASTDKYDRDVLGLPQVLCFLATAHYIRKGQSGEQAWELDSSFKLLNTVPSIFLNQRTLLYDFSWKTVVSDKKYLLSLDYSSLERSFSSIVDKTLQEAETRLLGKWIPQ